MCIRDSPKAAQVADALLQLSEGFQDKMLEVRNNFGTPWGHIDVAVSRWLPKGVEESIKMETAEKELILQVSKSILRVVAELTKNSLKAYGIINGASVDPSRIREDAVVRINAHVLDADQSAREQVDLGKLQLQEGESIVQLSVSDRAGGLAIPLEQALREGISTFGTSGTGLTEISETLGRLRADFRFENDPGRGLTAKIWVPGKRGVGSC